MSKRTNNNKTGNKTSNKCNNAQANKNNVKQYDSKGRRGNQRSNGSRGPKPQENTTVEDEKNAVNNGNHESWYLRYPELARDAAKIQWSTAAGTRFHRGFDADQTTVLEKDRFPMIPGIMTFQVKPTFGFSNAKNSTLNLAFTQMYNYVRYAMSGSATYDAVDLGIYVTGMTQIYSYINYLIRVHGMVSLYSDQNRYYPDALLKAQHIDPTSLRHNEANFRARINLLIQAVASLSVPNTIDLFQREAFMYAGIYSESTSARDQVYMYVPAGFWKYHINDATSMGELIFAELPWANATNESEYADYVQLCDYGEQLLAAMLFDEDCNIMSSNILKAYGSEGTMKVSMMPEYTPIVPTFDEKVLTQMRNAVILGDVSKMEFKQDSTASYIIASAEAPATSVTAKQLASMRQTLNVDTDAAITDGYILVASRLKVATVRVGSGASAAYRLIAGSEIITKVSAVLYAPTDESNTTIKEVSVDNTFVPSLYTDTVIGWSAFNYHPEIFVNPTDKFCSSVGFYDYDNFAFMNIENIQLLHECAMRSMLFSPAVNKAAFGNS